jgi:MOSC domain-containing protein YiiM
MSALTIHDLQKHFFKAGTVVSLCTRPARLAPVIFTEELEAISGKGLIGDRYQNNGSRQVTLIAQESLMAASSFLSKLVSPADVRRNIVTKEINLLALKGKRFQIGTAIFEFSGECHPCSRMEVNLGVGGYNALRGNGGITARIIRTGIIKVGDNIMPLPE